jgi:hypothetical protein
MKSLLFALEALLADVRRLHPGVRGLDRDYITMKVRLEKEGSSFATIALPSLGKHLDRCLSLGRFTPHPSFSRMKGSTLPKFLSGLFSEIFELNGTLLDNGTEHLYVKSLREILYLFRKLALDTSRATQLDLCAKGAFFGLELDVPSYCTSDFFVDSVSRFILKDLDVFGFLEGRNGPGAVSEGTSGNQKWSLLAGGIDSFDDSLMPLGYDLESYLKIGTYAPYRDPRADCVRLVTVPKNSRSRRTITIEPAVKQFSQQALNTHLRSKIATCPIMRTCLSLDDQSKNRKLAEIGSRNGSYATIDLSSASDLMGLSLVQRIFAHRPLFLDLCLRARCAEVKGKNSPLLKYAGMGNATTFPIQSVVFAVIAIASDLEARRVYPSYRNVKASARRVRTFGDDIIVRTDAYHQTVDRLSRFGLKVNQDKSFNEGNFRESCGTDRFRGHDVTPIYIRFEPSVTSMTASAVLGLVSNSNSFWELGCYSLAQHLANVVERANRIKLPLVRRESGVVGFHTRQDWCQVQRWHPTLHYWEVKSLDHYTTKYLDPLDGYAALLKFFHTPLLGRPVKHLEHSQRRFSLKQRTKWVRAS